MSCHISSTFHLLHHLPTMSVLSLLSLSGAGTILVLRLDRGAGGQQHLDHFQVAFIGRIRQRPVTSASSTRKVTG